MPRDRLRLVSRLPARSAVPPPAQAHSGPPPASRLLGAGAWGGTLEPEPEQAGPAASSPQPDRSASGPPLARYGPLPLGPLSPWQPAPVILAALEQLLLTQLSPETLQLWQGRLPQAREG